MKFVEMSRTMCDQWKQVDQATKNIFQELAEEGKVQCLKHCLEAKQEKTRDPVPTGLVCNTDVSSSKPGRPNCGRLFNEAPIPLQEMFPLLLTSNPQYFLHLLYCHTVFILVISKKQRSSAWQHGSTFI